MPSTDKERHPTRWILWLTLLTSIQTLGFVGVSIITVSSYSKCQHLMVEIVENTAKSQDGQMMVLRHNSTLSYFTEHCVRLCTLMTRRLDREQLQCEVHYENLPM